MPDPAFLFHVYRDALLARRLVGELRSHYPQAAILCLTDGRSPKDLATFCEANGVTLVKGKRLKLMATGGEWCDRMLQMFLERSTAETLIKLDPDSRVHRAFALPDAAWFGDVRSDGFFRPLIRGGCMGFSRTFAQRLLSSKLLANPIYSALPFGYLRYSVFKYPHEPASEEWISFTDGIFADAAFRLGVEPTQWQAVCSKFRDALPDDLTPYAVTHPHVTL